MRKILRTALGWFLLPFLVIALALIAVLLGVLDNLERLIKRKAVE
jgi:hypothetical protein